ncbi:MAG TPA: HAMP domain-containing sensor histidine kinase [Solirubrobacteraceae bacterium]|nr:HAMP domain-containing sensor histidine kinase [Solirubrobacteraceae bacterium]
MTLRTRIAAVASLSVAVAVIAAAIGLYAAVRSDLRGEVDSALRARARVFTTLPGLASRGGPPGPNGPPGPDGGGFPGRVEPAPFGAASGYVQFISPQGTVEVPGGQGTAPTRIAVTAGDRAIAARGSGSGLSDRSVRGTKLRVLTVGTGEAGAVLIARPLSEVEHELGRLLLILALIGGGGIVLAALLGALVARTALAPVARFTRRTETLTGSLDLSERLEVEGRDELARLADSFNATLEALERSVRAQRHLIADASHELRTPISSLRANIQILGEAGRLGPQEQESLRRDIVEELDELTALVGDVVELARGASPEGAVDDVRLDEVVQAAVARAGRRGEVRFALSLEPTIVRGQADRIDRAVSNLVDNARRFSPEASSVEVALRDGVLTVRDHGPGFEEADLPFVFDRFYRAEEARKLPGSGLGLAIVRQAAEACGGFAEAANAPGGGALLRVGFGPPLAPGAS